VIWSAPAERSGDGALDLTHLQAYSQTAQCRTNLPGRMHPYRNSQRTELISLLRVLIGNRVTLAGKSDCRFFIVAYFQSRMNSDGN